MPVTGRRLLAFSAAYGVPQETSSTDTVLLPKAVFSGVGGIAIDAGGMTITNLAAPVNATDATTKQYVDGIAIGISAVPAVRALAATNQTLSGTPIIDGYQTVAKDRVLLIGQTTASQNGVWVVTGSGSWTRPTGAGDYVSGANVAGKFCFVESGSVYGKQGWLCTSQPGSDICDTSSLTFTQFSGLGEVTCGNGLVANLNTISINLATNPGLYFSNGAVGVQLPTNCGLSLSASGLSVYADGTTTSTSNGPVRVLGVPQLFTIAGTATQSTVSAVALNTLTAASTSIADTYHTHQSVLTAQSTVGIHTNGSTALAAGDPVYWSATANTLARGDAQALNTATIIGVSAGALAANGTGQIVKQGVIAGVLNNATVGMPVFLNVGGGLTQSYPSASGAVILQIGFAKSATDLDVAIAYIGERA